MAWTVVSDKMRNSMVGTINIEETFNLSQHCANFVEEKLEEYYENWKRYIKDPHS